MQLQYKGLTKKKFRKVSKKQLNGSKYPSNNKKEKNLINKSFEVTKNIYINRKLTYHTVISNKSVLMLPYFSLMHFQPFYIYGSNKISIYTNIDASDMFFSSSSTNSSSINKFIMRLFACGFAAQLLFE